VQHATGSRYAEPTQAQTPVPHSPLYGGGVIVVSRRRTRLP